MLESWAAPGRWLPDSSSAHAGLGGACSGGCWQPPLRMPLLTIRLHQPFPRCPCCVLETCCTQAHLVLSGRGLWGLRGRPGLGAVRSAGRPLPLCGARRPRELVSAPDGDFCTHPHVCSQLTWLEGLRFFVFLQFVFLSAQHFSRPGAPQAVCRALPWSGAWGWG